MKSSNSPLAPYCEAMESHIEQIMGDLVGLEDILVQRDLSVHEYRSAERLLQLLVESAIGLAKHWSKLLKVSPPKDAYQTFSRLHEKGVLTEQQLLQWRKTIGLRNALVHDYLNIDRQIIIEVIRKQYYQSVYAFTQLAIKALSTKQ
ncbi:type VII toxin-antitoxin system HepT family RNase toxin [Bowmanella denitrificans]|uniref:type VII toxin-antitoxin system HepT family RNase toxin n=1 Tax=Bowmanella denitrificans TaxID=366582 RepID=UPI001FE8F0CB|nr:DUF86 domain-containing protein [Bowmanella denitrificans]